MLIAGIDPGKQGAVAIISTESRAYIETMDMPLDDNEWCPWKMVEFIESLAGMGVERITMEACHSFPGIGSATNASVMEAYGMWRAAIACEYSESEVKIVTAFSWKKHHGVIYPIIKAGKVATKAEKDKAYAIRKDLAVAKARECFPHKTFTTPRGRVLDGHAEAALIALYGSALFAAVPSR